MTTHIRFYFDYMSPYAYVNWGNLQRLLKEYAGQLEVTYHPISFPTLIRAWGTSPASAVPPKTAFIFKDIYRITKNRHMPFSVPAKWPFPTGLLLCLSSASVGGTDQPRIINAFWNAIWGHSSGEGLDLSDEEQIKKILNGLGLDSDGLLKYAKSDLIRKELLDATEEAANRYKVFGVPTMIVTCPHHKAEDSELYFGNDQILSIRTLLDGGIDHMRSAPEPLLNFLKAIPDKQIKVQPRPTTTDTKPTPKAKL